jgi:hypothetical protein
MNSSELAKVLSRLSAIHNRSFPVFLLQSSSWVRGANDKPAETLKRIAEANQVLVDRIGRELYAHQSVAEHGEFPMYYADWIDLSPTFMVNSAITEVRRDVAAINECVDELAEEPMLLALAQEALGEAKGHVDSLVELTEAPAAS